MTDQIYAVIREMASEKEVKALKYTDLMERCTSKGYKPDQVDACIEEYEELNIWQINTAHTKLKFV